MKSKAKYFQVGSYLGKNVVVRYEDHGKDSIGATRGVLEGVVRVGTPEVLCMVVRTSDDPERRTYVPREDVLTVRHAD